MSKGFLAKLSLVVLLLLYAPLAAAHSDDEAKPPDETHPDKLARDFIEAYADLESYSVRMTIQEYLPPLAGKAGAAKGPQKVIDVNHQMERGELSVTAREGMGAVVNGREMIYVGGSGVSKRVGERLFGIPFVKIWDPLALGGLYVTVNHAGFGMMKRFLERRFDELSLTENGGLTTEQQPDGTVTMSYRRRSTLDDEVDVEYTSVYLESGEEEIMEIEEEHGTLACLLYFANSEQYEGVDAEGGVEAVFKQSEGKTIKVPVRFFDFDLTFDTKTHFPTQFILYGPDQHILGEYAYSNFQPTPR